MQSKHKHATRAASGGDHHSDASDLSFLPRDEELVARWNKEWCRYFTNYPGKMWFENLSEPDERVEQLRERIAGMTSTEIFEYQMLEYEPKLPLSIHVAPCDLLYCCVAEIGCGPGQLGKQLGHVVQHYLGIDFSKLALDIARILSPSTCDYVELRDTANLARYCDTRDTVIGRHFFIHQNRENATWVTRLASKLLRPGGLLVADYYYPNEEGAKRIEEGLIRPANAPLDPEYPSRMFVFKDREIEEIATANGLRIDKFERVPSAQRQYIRMTRVD